MSSSSERFFGPYRIVKILVAGQTSQITEVRHDTTGERFAAKTLLQNFRKDKDQVAYLRNEFAVGQSLDHPRLIKTVELVEGDGLLCVIMEMFDGANLKQQLMNKGAEALVPLVSKIIAQCAEALNYFHQEGWIHRDIKPDNFMANDDGNVKMIDFALAEKKKTGLAKLFAGKSKVQGTRSYMSPEQIRGQALDARADIYSFGCMVYQLICGNPPFSGANPNDVLQRHLTSPPPPLQSQNSNVTPEFGALIGRMLSKKPSGRPETMTHFLSEFKNTKMFKKPPK